MAHCPLMSGLAQALDGTAHQPKRSRATEIHNSVALLGKPVNLSLFPQAELSAQWSEDMESKGLPNEGEDDDVI